MESATKLAKQMIVFQKSMFENAFNNLPIVQDQAESMTTALLHQAPWFPEEGKNAIDDWVKACKRGREDYKKMIDESFDNMEKFFPGE